MDDDFMPGGHFPADVYFEMANRKPKAEPAATPEARIPEKSRDALDVLAFELYGRKAKPRDYIGGSEADIFLDAAKALAALRVERDRALEAIYWADGQRDEFRQRGPKEGAYWWRKELMKRAGLARPIPAEKPDVPKG